MMMHSRLLAIISALVVMASVMSPAAGHTPATEAFTGSVDASGSRRSAHTIDVEAGHQIVAELGWADEAADLSLFLKDPGGTIVAMSAWTENPERVSHPVEVSGTYRLEVKAVSGAADYTLAVTLEHPEPDSDGQSFSGSVDASGSRRSAHTVDVEAGQELEAVLDWDDPAADLSLFLKDPDGTIVAMSAWTDKPERVSHVPEATGTYRLEVKAVSGATDYTLTVALADADPGPGGSGISGTVDAASASWMGHALEVEQPGTRLELTLDWDNADANLNLFLKDPSGTIVSRATSTDTKPETLTHVATEAGTWTVGVKAVTGASAYTVDVVQTPVGDPGDGDPADWPRFHHDDVNSGVSDETTIGASTAPDVGLQWQANTGNAAYSSPAVVYNPTLDKRLVYVGNQTGVMSAYDAATGERKWSWRADAGIASSPAVVDGVVYVGSSDYNVYALDATTGAEICSYHTGGVVAASPVVTDVDGTGRTIFVGDNGLTGGDDGGSFWALHAVDPDDGFADCSLKWQFDGFESEVSGSWAPVATGVDAQDRPVVVVGGSSPDNAVYAIDARDGSLRWRYQTEVFHPDNDVGAGAAISAPGVNGFGGGVAYVPGKNRIVYALDLTTGEKLWEFRIRDDAPSVGGATRATPVLHGDRLYVGYGAGMYALDAVTGEKIWRSQDVGPATGEIVSSAALTGADGDEVLFAGDFHGDLLAFSAATGEQLWSYPVGFVYASPAVSDGRVFVPSGDGFLHAFGIGGAIGERPETVMDVPVDGSEPQNPDGPLTMRGSATDDTGVDRVLVAVKNKNKNTWWDAAAGQWTKVFTQNEATLSSPGGTATDWTFDFPVPFGGGVFFAQADAVDVDGQHDPTVETADFTIPSLGNPPETTIDEPAFAEVFHFPHGERQEFPITIRGTATDSGGATPGITEVRVVVRNIEHGEHFCGSEGCATGDGESTAWRPTYTVLKATLDDPGAVTTGWSLTFPTYDHPHKYRLVAWAVDADGEIDETKAVIGRICVRDVGDNACV